MKCGLGEVFGNVISTKKSFDLNSSEDSERSYEAFKYYDMWLSKMTQEVVSFSYPETRHIKTTQNPRLLWEALKQDSLKYSRFAALNDTKVAFSKETKT